ncbi:hypothetical protein [Amycolatopsis solani]|uniref:hypothetical protein n=1 Tax=Amycolatopsis solani TaxID=3028615 RepID=UPI0025B08CCC|nr:hypothetical protein [Amycolatopsis sp. MEP2-6]
MLRDRRIAALLLGDLLANVGTGMLRVAMPVQTLSPHGGVPKAISIGLVETAPLGLALGGPPIEPAGRTPEREPTCA